VTAVVRDPARLPPTRARVVTADLALADPAALQAALQAAIDGADAVLSGLGPRSKADVGVAGQGTRAIIAAMGAAGVRRIVVVSAAPIATVPSPGRPEPPKYDPGDGFLIRHLADPILKLALRENYADLAQMEDELRGSSLDWTAVRPPRLTDRPVTGTYRTARDRNLRHGLFISRADVAHCMLRVLDQPETFGHPVALAN
jgi:putative NADH-flavin reductase